MSFKQAQIKLAIVDDHNLFRKGLITLINLAYKNNCIIVFEAGSGEELIAKLDKKLLPDIILMDIDMPDMDGFETVSWLQQHYPDISILVVSMIEKEEAIVRMLKMGVKGYLSKDIEVEDIHEAIKAIMNKGYYYTDFITGKLIDSIKNEGKQIKTKELPGNPIWDQLNENERRFLELACTTDLTYEQIAGQMFLSPKTIDSYRDAIFSKFKIKNRVGLVLFAFENELVKIPRKG
jgi:two-component system, NarL family, invasion response regulator UvrY